MAASRTEAPETTTDGKGADLGATTDGKTADPRATADTRTEAPETTAGGKGAGLGATAGGKAVGRDFASASLPRHLARGALGFGALAASVACVPAVGPISLALLPAGLLALRGCPMCWAIGLLQTVSRGRLQRTCTDDHCELTVRRP
ncbi:hypothetical protein [Streptomyces musisoli]|uniref:hypothetical protein n=1 Tax=Streptomyces musisoli TaxID=2802280 RepID=UPI001F294C56|nr:hypothetical protein [Streptomyces musisoli]